MRPANPDPHGRRRSRSRERHSSAGPAFLAIAVVAGAALYAGAQALYSWYSSESPQTEAKQRSYYHLRPEDAAESTADAALKSTTSTGTAPSEVAAEDSSVDGMNRCVCCMERPQSFMFVECGHLCLCEPCLVQLTRASGAAGHTAVRSGQEPVRVACPCCRHVGPLVKTYAA